MNRETWNLIKNNKNFNVRVFRRSVKWLIGSISLNIVLVLCLFYVYINTPERDYYATSGITPPVLLKALAAPNFSSVALLEPDPPTDDVPRVIPE
jgi:intracellular multiplication protein IcmM